MIRKINTHFFTFYQNNINGNFITNDKVAEFIIIEAFDRIHAKAIVREIIRDYQSYCSCCGHRWDLDMIDEYTQPMYNNKSVYEENFGTTIVYFLDGEIERLWYNKESRDELNGC